MPTHEAQSPTPQPPVMAPKVNPARSFEIVQPGQDMASSPTNPFARRSYETWSINAATPEVQPQRESEKRIEQASFQLFAPGQPPPARNWIQTKLSIGQPNDEYEQEADRVAAQVMAMPEPTVQREIAPDEDTVQMKGERSSDGSLQAGEDIESRLNQSKGGGEPLSEEVRSFMEPRFGADFSQVRVHTGSEAVQMNRDLNAQAFTHKQDVYFGLGKSPRKDALTAHELTHVVQHQGFQKESNLSCKQQVVNSSVQQVMLAKQSSPVEQSDLRRGARGLEVVYLQRRLNLNRAKIVEDGIFGEKTEKAVINFQKQRRLIPPLIVFGVVDQQTMYLLNREPLASPKIEKAFDMFVATGIVDQDIAVLLEEMFRFPPDSMTHQVAVFAHHELSNGNLVGIVRFSNRNKIKNKVSRNHHSLIDGMAKWSQNHGLTFDIKDESAWRGCIFMNDQEINQAMAPGLRVLGGARDFMIRVLAHELTHFRNRVSRMQHFEATIDSADYVDVVLAQSLAGTQNTRSLFIDELAARHVAWYIECDQFKAAGRPHSPLRSGQFFHFALNFALDFGSYSDNGYMKTLSQPTQFSPNFRKQVGLWFEKLQDKLFHDDSTKNAAIQNFIKLEIASVKPDFNVPQVPPNGAA